MIDAPHFSAAGAKKKAVSLPAALFDGTVNEELLHRAVITYLSNQRQGTHSTKTRAEVSGGNQKPWKQKGTGRARQGSIRATQWKGGGKPFGPTPHSYQQDMPRNMRREALRAAVTAKVVAGELKVVDALDATDGKTKSLVTRLGGWGLAAVPTLLVVQTLGEPVRRAARNVPWLTVETPAHVSVYQLMRCRQALFERSALLALQEALSE